MLEIFLSSPCHKSLSPGDHGSQHEQSNARVTASKRFDYDLEAPGQIAFLRFRM